MVFAEMGAGRGLWWLTAYAAGEVFAVERQATKTAFAPTRQKRIAYRQPGTATHLPRGGRMIGFGHHHYVHDSGREGDDEIV